VTIDLAAPVLKVVRRAGNASGTLDLLRLIEVLIRATRRRTTTNPRNRAH